MNEIKKYTFDSVPQFVENEGKTILVHFGATERKVSVDDEMASPDKADGNEAAATADSDTQEAKATKTVYDCYSIRIPQPIDRDRIVNAIVSEAYPSDRMQAIINNHFLNLATIADGEVLDEDEQVHEAEYEEMQAWRKKAKEVAKEVLAEYLRNC